MAKQALKVMDELEESVMPRDMGFRKSS